MNGFGNSKVLGTKSLEMTKGGPSGGNNSRSYPKGGAKPGNTQTAPFNPQKVPATTKYVGGVGAGGSSRVVDTDMDEM